MPSETSNLPGGGKRVTQHIDGVDLIGNPDSEVTTDDYDENGNWISGTKTDNNGDIWNVNSAGCTTHIIGNDGRND